MVITGNVNTISSNLHFVTLAARLGNQAPPVIRVHLEEIVNDDWIAVWLDRVVEVLCHGRLYLVHGPKKELLHFTIRRNRLKARWKPQVITEEYGSRNHILGWHVGGIANGS